MLQEVKYASDLSTDLIGCAENMAIVLLEASNSDQTAEST